MNNVFVLTVSLLVAGSLPVSAGNSNYVTDCSLGCSNGSSGQAISCSTLQVPWDAPLSFTWSEPIDFASVSLVSFQIADVVTGAVPPGSFSLKDAHTLVFTPLLDAGALTWSPNAIYLVRIRGTAQGDAPPFIVSTLGNANFTRVDCLVSPSLPASNVVNVCGTSANSVGPGACMGWSGSASIAGNDFSLSTEGLPAEKPGIYLASNTANLTPFGDGTLCLSQTGLLRIGPATQSDALGVVQQPVDWNGLAGGLLVSPGQAVHFQLLYRDPNTGSAGFNLSDSLRVDLVP